MDNGGELPRAEVAPRGRLSVVWLLPLIAVFVGGWLVYDTYTKRGPVIAISFQRGDGIEADKTELRFKSVRIGKVTDVRIADDLQSVVIVARIDKHFAPRLGAGARFWVVRPRVGARGVTGLGTLVSGAYIEIDPGEGAAQRRFKGLETPPIITADVPGNRYVLESDKLGSIQAGSGVFYRDIQVGEVLGHELAADGSRITIYIFVRDPYTLLVRKGTNFSNASGINVSVGADGIDLRTTSLQSLLVGGVTFDLPLGKTGEPAPAGTMFWLFDSAESIGEAQFTEQVPFVMYFNDSVRGLAVGAPVEFKGIKLGSVSQIDLEVDDDSGEVRIAVTVALQPQRLLNASAVEHTLPQDIVGGLIARGLRARLQTGSLLTGQMFVELGLYPESPPEFVDGERSLAQIPTLPSEFVEVKESMTKLLDKLHRLPLESIGEHAVATLAELEALVKSPQIDAALSGAATSMESIRGIADALTAELPLLTAQIRTTLADIDANSALHARLGSMLEQVEGAARAVRGLAETVERQPNAIIWGKRKADERDGERE
ncbi:MAG: PqiB family protein [Gammaproteobacteria bacterium]|jgi:paraquat-inducible protein B